MIPKQIVVAAGGALGIATVAIAWEHAARIFAPLALPAGDAASRIAYVTHWLILPGVTLLAGIVAAAIHRFDASAIDGTRTPASHSLEINLRYNENTLEQVVLAAIAYLGLALTLCHDQLVLIPAMACLFAFGRITFWIGYLLHPLGRAFGMVLTMLPTAIAYGWLVWHALGA